jgi:repressor LexA
VDDLSPRQREILDFIVAAIDSNGVVPTYREIGAALGIGSTNGVSDRIKALERKGFLERTGGPGSPRSLRVTGGGAAHLDDEASVSVPIIGRIAAGTPLLAHESYEGTLRVDAGLLPLGGQVFALVVTGESMIEDGIHDGDYLFVRQKKEVRNGQIAVVMVEGEATVKRFYREGSRIRLQPANSAMEPIWLDARSGEVQVVGEAVGLYRRI